jgi:DNA modification methylase
MPALEGTLYEVLRGDAAWCIVHSDALHILRNLPDGCADAFVTDPPYSSGGAFRGHRVKETLRLANRDKLALMERLVTVAPAGGLVVDPFAGSATTCTAAVRQGRRVIGMEINREWAELARERVRADVSGSDYAARAKWQQAPFGGRA